ncbi:hypothetical protein [Lysinibacillus sphaericus]|uniref:Uncharacterized protein n=1 Tax=Lysinibacillus sphaericus TaxID=1421 RepID=A0A6H0A042_LYSSH|nr:hypothetical protein [Lysinibacillus sphaericus]QIS31127.1 hypothetical protein [Lysinibacillus sphaericus]QPA61318.1 hypothetical protein INQ55_23595 [Lysinibacillus sphaericus]
MEVTTIQISTSNIREVITTLINDYIRIEKNETGLAYQQQSNFKMGQINIITKLMDEEWDFKRTGQCYYDFLKYLVEKYELSVWRINDLFEQKEK